MEWATIDGLAELPANSVGLLDRRDVLGLSPVKGDLVLERYMKVCKGVVFVVLVVAVAVGVFNGVVVAVSAYFGPFYEGDAEQTRNFGIWLVGNGVTVVGAVVGGVVWYCRYLRRPRG
jgi:hypothetical protein